MGKLINDIIQTENLLFAWKKVKNSYQVGDIWYDEIELASFEADLYNNLGEIRKEIKSGKYTLREISPLPFPKGCDKDGKGQVRQTFEISVKDQVTWMAVVNVIGKTLDYQMPWWSYGNRLYVSIWKDQEQWEIGWYNNSKGQLYRKWNQSWPLFRRNISLTAKIMCCKRGANIDNIKEYLDESESSVYNNNSTLPDHFKSKYLDSNYWKRDADKLYWGTIDFSKFYPSVNRKTVIDNIIKYSPETNTDDEFKNLLYKLMDFKINISNWNPKELKEIKLEDPDAFHGLPTGLFVAGFLANVALLDIDEKISKDLEKNKNVAHFRFVDDHVILSYDFEKLKKWIETYKDYLCKASNGVTFNYDKIEPSELSNILNQDWRNENKNDLEKEEKKAKKAASLDPAFPAPLMTQTLAKVSAISRSDFEFLSQNEEEQLISDLEHLLLTDFPDHELRKDTRISFAASILSRIVPNTKDDYTKIYAYQKQIQYKIRDYKERYQKSDDEFITDKLHSLIFDDNINIEKFFSEWIDGPENCSPEELNLINEIKEEKKHLVELLIQVKKQKKFQERRIYKLLKKAVSENPEKVRIWCRVIDYCKKVGCCSVKETYDKIDELRTNGNIHDLSASFLRTLFINILSDRLMQVVSTINNSRINTNNLYSTSFFINDVFDEKFLQNIFNKEDESDKSYYLRTFEFYRFVLGSAIFILNDTEYIKNSDILIKQYNLIDWRDNPELWISETHSKDINNWLYWLLWQTHDKTACMPLLFWKSIQKCIDYSKVTYKSLIQPFPDISDFPKNDDSYLKKILSGDFDEGWIYEVFKKGKDNLNDEIKSRLKEKYINVYNNIFSDILSVWDFIQWQRKELSSNKNELDAYKRFFDPRFSEWFALKIIKNVISEVTKSKNFFLNNITKIHPANFIFCNKEIIENQGGIGDWKKWDSIQIEAREPDCQISDMRYTIRGLLDNNDEIGEKAKVHALGIILLQLITNNTDLPWVWNSTDKSLIWETLFLNKIQNVSISSYTLLILHSCFSSRNREKLQLLKENIPDNIKINSPSDIPAINDLGTFKRYVEKAQKILERYQLSMEDNEPRQLLPISLELLSINNNPLEDTDNE